MHTVFHRPLLKAIAAVAASIAVVAAPATSVGQSASTRPGPEHTAKLFNVLCLSKLPDIEAVAKLAKAQGFAELTGDALKPYRPQVPAERLQVWRFKDLGAGFTLMIARAKPDDQFKQSNPDFAQSTNYSCSLIPIGQNSQAETVAELAKLIGRNADETFDQGPLQVHAWSAKTDKLLIHAYHYAVKQRAATRLISVTIFVKN